MQDRDCVAFLRQVLPGLGFRWQGYRRVRRQVCRRIARRMESIGLSDLSAYEARLQTSAVERDMLRSLCRVTISRFWRDRAMWERLGEHMLPLLAAKVHGMGETEFKVLSMGSASGEEPYTFSILWHELVKPKLSFQMSLLVSAIELDEDLIARSLAGVYPASSVKDIPPDILRRAFRPQEGGHSLKPDFREGVEFFRQDISRELPEGPFHMVLCRNLVFTYFSPARQTEMLSRIQDRLIPGGVLALGSHERLPSGQAGFVKDEHVPYLYVREAD